jgi:hypothetical protein
MLETVELERRLSELDIECWRASADFSEEECRRVLSSRGLAHMTLEEVMELREALSDQVQ